MTVKPPDPLTRKELAKKYGFALKVIYANDELKTLFERAVNGKKGQWGVDKFVLELQDTEWYNTNADYARKAWAAEQLGTRPDGTLTADWQAQLDRARVAVETSAAQMGAQLTPDEVEKYVRRYIYEGWQEQPQTMAQAMAKEISASEGDVATGMLMGGAGNLEEALKQTALKNGLKLDQNYYISAAKSVASGLSTAEDWMRDIRAQGASLWPAWSDKINAGVDAEDLLSGYKTIMAQTFEIPPEYIDLNDPTLRQAVTQMDDKGNPQVMGLWEFQTKLRNDPRWLDTKQASDQLSNVGMDVLKRMGFTG